MACSDECAVRTAEGQACGRALTGGECGRSCHRRQGQRVVEQREWSALSGNIRIEILMSIRISFMLASGDLGQSCQRRERGRRQIRGMGGKEGKTGNSFTKLACEMGEMSQSNFCFKVGEN